MEILAEPVAHLDHADSLGLLRRQTRVLELIAAGTPLPAVLAAVTESLEELIPDSRCSVLLLDAAAQTLHHGAAPTLPQEYSDAIDGLRIADDAGSCGAAAYLDAEVVAEDITRDWRWTRFRDLALPHGLRACWSRPIRGHTTSGPDTCTAVLGTFAVYHDVPHVPNEREHRLVERFTHLASVAIEHARLYGALAESEERFRRAFEDNAVGMALTALDGRFGKVNRALQEMLGRSEAELLAVDVQSLRHPESDASLPDALTRLTVGDGDSVQFGATFARPDGTAVRAAVTASVVRGADGTPVYLSMNVLDVTARQAAERDRQARREAELARGVAEAASHAKSQFLSALSHEMRTPCKPSPGSPSCWARWTFPTTVGTPRSATSQAPARTSSRWSMTYWTSRESRRERCRCASPTSLSMISSVTSLTCSSRWQTSAESPSNAGRAGSPCGPTSGGCARSCSTS